MAAYFQLELDTRAPVVTLGEPVLDNPYTITLPYAVDEPGLTFVQAVDNAGRSINGVIDADTVTFDLGGLSWLSGWLNVGAEDDVGNHSQRSLYLTREGPVTIRLVRDDGRDQLPSANRPEISWRVPPQKLVRPT